MNNEIYNNIMTLPLKSLIELYPLTEDFLLNLRISSPDMELTLSEIMGGMDKLEAEEFGITISDIPSRLCEFLENFMVRDEALSEVRSLTIMGGFNKRGKPEGISITIKQGEVIAVIGPTGSGKSRLLADIECLAQMDTPTGRLILINGKEVPDEIRFEMEGRLVAQLSQNMNFVMDLTVREFLVMHARSRLVRDVETTVKLCMDCANSLAGEAFDECTKVTQLSGGQSRALMIADTAYMSSSPLVLIDEIENAGIDRKRAIEVLTKKDKIVLTATHDPLLALNADKRIIIQNGGIIRIIETTSEEKNVLNRLQEMDNTIQALRYRLRAGDLINSI